MNWATNVGFWFKLTMIEISQIQRTILEEYQQRKNWKREETLTLMKRPC